MDRIRNESFRRITMKMKSIIPLIAVGFTTASAIARNMPPGPPPDIIAVTLDKDHDHELSSREIRNAGKSLLKLDKDKDEALSEEELRPEPPEGKRKRKKDDGNARNPPPKPPPSALMSAIDTDGNGSLSKEELEAAPEKLLDLDEDDNGRLDNEEVPALGDEDQGPPPGGGGGHPPHPPGGPPRGRR